MFISWGQAGGLQVSGIAQQALIGRKQRAGPHGDGDGDSVFLEEGNK